MAFNMNGPGTPGGVGRPQRYAPPPPPAGQPQGPQQGSFGQQTPMLGGGQQNQGLGYTQQNGQYNAPQGMPGFGGFGGFNFGGFNFGQQQQSPMGGFGQQPFFGGSLQGSNGYGGFNGNMPSSMPGFGQQPQSPPPAPGNPPPGWMGSMEPLQSQQQQPQQQTAPGGQNHGPGGGGGSGQPQQRPPATQGYDSNQPSLTNMGPGYMPGLDGGQQLSNAQQWQQNNPGMGDGGYKQMMTRGQFNMGGPTYQQRPSGGQGFGQRPQQPKPLNDQFRSMFGGS